MMLRCAAAIAPCALALAACATASPEPASGPPLVTPEAAAQFQADMRAYVDRDNAPGIITYVVEDGRVVLADAYGIADVGRGTPMRVDTQFRIASLTKPITTAALLMLYEEDKWQLDDPVARYIPELENLMVSDQEGNLTAPVHAPTMRELLTHTGGFVYGLGAHPSDIAYRESSALDSTTSMQAMIDKLAAIPLKHQPGTAWEYSVSTDIAGALVERISGEPFDQFLRERLFAPLGMADTDFYVRPEDVERAAALHAPDPDGVGFVVAGGAGFDEVGGLTAMPSLPSGGGGLWSTVEDYSRFLQMLLDGGELDGVRYLEPETVELMLTDQLPEGLTATASVRRAGFSFGFGIAADRSVSGQALPGGMISWPGIFGVYWWADPAENLQVFTVMQVPVTGARGKENLGEAGPAAFYAALAAE
jgi:CubicO group peptidase (beta-lactamase class C family)